MKAIHVVAALGAAAVLAGSALAAEAPAVPGGPAKADAGPGLLVTRHLTEEKANELARTFFDDNGRRPGVVTLQSGIQYEVLKAGMGPRPEGDSRVRLNYTGSLVDGTQFGGSNLDGKGKPAEFALGKLIPGLREAVGRMEQGAKWRIYVPPRLGYDLHNPLFRKVTVFDVELVSAAPAQVASASGRDAAAHEHQVVGLR